MYYFLELPKPQLGDLSELRKLSIRIRRERTPNVLGYCYQELCALDTIQVLYLFIIKDG